MFGQKSKKNHIFCCSGASKWLNYVNFFHFILLRQQRWTWIVSTAGSHIQTVARSARKKQKFGKLLKYFIRFIWDAMDLDADEICQKSKVSENEKDGERERGREREAWRKTRWNVLYDVGKMRIKINVNKFDAVSAAEPYICNVSVSHEFLVKSTPTTTHPFALASAEKWAPQKQ